MADFPRVFKVRQHFQVVECEDVAAAVEAQLSGLNLSEKIKPGETVAISAGSRASPISIRPSGQSYSISRGSEVHRLLSRQWAVMAAAQRKVSERLLKATE